MKTIALLLCILTSTLSAGDKYPEIKLTDGTVLKEVEVKSVESRGLRCVHADGAGLIRRSLLPAELAKKYATEMELENGEREAKEKTERSKVESAEASQNAEIAATAAANREWQEQADRLAPAEQIGPFKAQFVGARKAQILQFGSYTAGYEYAIKLQNTSDVTVRANAGISYRGSEPLWYNLSLAPGQVTYVRAESILGSVRPGMTVDITLLAPDGSKKSGNCKIPQDADNVMPLPADK
jgi:hypothetical protein